MPSSPTRAAVLFCLASLAAPPAPADEGALDTAGFQAPEGWFAPPEANDPWGLFTMSRAAVRPDGWGAVAFLHRPDFELAWQLFTDDGHLEPCVVAFPDAKFRPTDVEFDRAGRLLVAGSVGYGDDSLLFVARFLYPTCELDATFDGDGYFTLDLPQPAFGRRLARMFFPTSLPGVLSERILLVGHTGLESAADAADVVLVRLHANGALDTELGGTGTVLLPFGGVDTYPSDVAIDADNRIVIAGTAGELDEIDQDAFVARALAEGGLDGSFGFGGWRRFHQGTSDRIDGVASLLRAPGGDLYLAGTSRLDGEPDVLSVTRLSGVHGFELDARTFSRLGSTSRIDAAALQGDWRLLVVGTTDAFDGDSDLFSMAFRIPGLDYDQGYNDTSDFDPMSYVPVDRPDMDGEIVVHGLGFSDGRPVVAGHAQNLTGNAPEGGWEPYALLQPFVLRLDNAYVFADGFESGDRSAW